jgi:hypothetical protein
MPNLLQTIFQAVSPMLQQMAPQQQQQQAPQQTQPQQTQRPPQPQTPAPNQQMINQLFSSFSQMVQQPPSASGPSNAPAQRNVNNNSTNQTTTNPQTSSAAVLMSQTFNAVNHAISGSQPTSVSSVIGSIAQGTMIVVNLIFEGLSPATPEEDNVLGDIIQKILDTITIPDMLQIMAGNWTSVQLLHPVLQNYVKELLNGDTSQSQVRINLAEKRLYGDYNNISNTNGHRSIS